jgi:hypothetical protein
MLAAVLLLTLPAAVAGTLAPGSPLDEALALHVTNTGLAHLGDVVEGLVPQSFPVSDLGGELACDEADADPLSYQLDELELTIAVENVDLVASDGRLDLTLYLTLGSTYSELVINGDCSILAGLDEVCGVELPTTAATAHIGFELELLPDSIRASVDDVSFWVSPVGNPLSGCTLSSAIGTLLGQDPEFISSLLMNLVSPELDGVGADIEDALSGAFDALWIETDLSLGDADLTLSIYPSSLVLDDSGLLLGLGASSSMSAISDCVPAGLGSETRQEGWPRFSETAWDGALTYDAGLFVNGDFVNHILWEVWASGLLCIDAGALAADAGINLSTDFLGTLYGDEFKALFPEDSPATLRGFSTLPPQVLFDDDVPLALDLQDFALETVAELDGRKVRVNAITLADDIGLDPGISSAAVAPILMLDLANLQFAEPVNEFLSPGFSDGVADFVPTILDQFGVGDSVNDLIPTFTIPTLYGVGLETVFWIPRDDGQWMGGFFLLDVDEVEPLVLEGCSGGSLGCGEGDTGGLGGGLEFEELLGCGTIEQDLGCAAGGDTGYDTGLGSSGDCGGCESSGGGCEDSSCSTTGRRKLFWPGWRLAMLGVFGTVIAIRRRR